MSHIKRYMVHSLCITLTILLFLLPLTTKASGTIVFVGSLETKNSVQGRWLNLLYTDLFGRLGYTFRYDNFPPKRASLLSDRGAVDGEINRVLEYQDEHPNMIRVGEPHFSITIAAYAVKPNISLSSWSSFDNNTFKVAYRRGIYIVEKNLTARIKPKYLFEINRVEQGINKLFAGRTDLYVGAEAAVRRVVKELKDDGVDVTKLYQVGVMTTHDMYVYLHQKHADLVPQVTELLKDMKEDGTVDEYREKAKGMSLYSVE